MANCNEDGPWACQPVNCNKGGSWTIPEEIGKSLMRMFGSMPPVPPTDDKFESASPVIGYHAYEGEKCIGVIFADSPEQALSKARMKGGDFVVPVKYRLEVKEDAGV